MIVGPKASTALASLTAQKIQELEDKIEKGFQEEVLDLKDLLEKAEKNPDFPEVETSPLIAPKIEEFLFESAQNSGENKSWDDGRELELKKRFHKSLKRKDDSWTVLYIFISKVMFALILHKTGEISKALSNHCLKVLNNFIF